MLGCYYEAVLLASINTSYNYYPLDDLVKYKMSGMGLNISAVKHTKKLKFTLLVPI